MVVQGTGAQSSGRCRVVLRFVSYPDFAAIPHMCSGPFFPARIKPDVGKIQCKTLPMQAGFCWIQNLSIPLAIQLPLSRLLQQAQKSGLVEFGSGMFCKIRLRGSQWKELFEHPNQHRIHGPTHTSLAGSGFG